MALYSYGLQVNLWNTLGWKPCTFAHLPLIMSESGEKLSKRKHKEVRPAPRNPLLHRAQRAVERRRTS